MTNLGANDQVKIEKLFELVATLTKRIDDLETELFGSNDRRQFDNDMRSILDGKPPAIK